MLSLERQNRYREQYRLSHPGWQPATEVYAGLVRDYLRENGGPDTRLLDLGCGRGGLVEQLNFPLQQIVGIDPDWHSLQQHRLDLPRTAAASDDLPFVAQSFDLVLASWLLEHLARPSRSFQEIHRILRPGGVFLFITPNGRHPLTWLNRGVGRFARLQGRVVAWLYGRAGTDAFPTYYRANSVTALQHLGQAGKLSLVVLYTIPDPTYLAFTPTLFRLMARLEDRLSDKRKLHLVGIFKRLS